MRSLFILCLCPYLGLLGCVGATSVVSVEDYSISVEDVDSEYVKYDETVLLIKSMVRQLWACGFLENCDADAWGNPIKINCDNGVKLSLVSCGSSIERYDDDIIATFSGEMDPMEYVRIEYMADRQCYLCTMSRSGRDVSENDERKYQNTVRAIRNTMYKIRDGNVNRDDIENLFLTDAWYRQISISHVADERIYKIRSLGLDPNDAYDDVIAAVTRMSPNDVVWSEFWALFYFFNGIQYTEMECVE